ncbi:MAG: double-strand break repair protein AddB, partial [Rhodobacteraceae bacterium]|nr:double-strand break repair protein AddB [Paracoccaceae bacterium]
MTRTHYVKSGLYGLAPGIDFPAALVAGLLDRFGAAPPDALARVTLYVNTTRMQRRIADLLTAEGARLLPRVRLITELGQSADADLPPVVPALRRRLELRQLVARLLALQPDLAPPSAAFDLATSLSALLDEMQSEGVGLGAITSLDVTDQSGHWARSQKFIALVGTFLTRDDVPGLDPQARQRQIVQALVADWQIAPPADPVILAGSTGSRGTTALLMRAVAALPQGAVVLPGLDPQMSHALWRSLGGTAPQQDHPQYRFARLAETVGADPAAIPPWTTGIAPPSAARNALVSLALRPAPVTDGWRRDGPKLGDLPEACRGLTLIEAADPRGEALAIALCLRQAVEDGKTAALITPDRILTRRVAAALDRWGIEPDDSAGAPLRQTAAGRLVRHCAGLAGQRLGAEPLLVLLKHPLVHAGAGRNRHLLWTRELELHLRRYGPAFPDAAALSGWAEKVTRTRHDSGGIQDWASWVAATCLGHDARDTAPLTDHAAWLIALLDALSRGPGLPPGDAPAPVWLDDDGTAAQTVLQELADEAAHGGDLDPGEFRTLIDALLGGEVRSAIRPDPRVMIWGTLEARVQGADLVVL